MDWSDGLESEFYRSHNMKNYWTILFYVSAKRMTLLDWSTFSCADIVVVIDEAIEYVTI